MFSLLYQSQGNFMSILTDSVPYVYIYHWTQEDLPLDEGILCWYALHLCMRGVWLKLSINHKRDAFMPSKVSIVFFARSGRFLIFLRVINGIRDMLIVCMWVKESPDSTSDSLQDLLFVSQL